MKPKYPFFVVSILLIVSLLVSGCSLFSTPTDESSPEGESPIEEPVPTDPVDELPSPEPTQPEIIIPTRMPTLPPTPTTEVVVEPTEEIIIPEVPSDEISEPVDEPVEEPAEEAPAVHPTEGQEEAPADTPEDVPVETPPEPSEPAGNSTTPPEQPVQSPIYINIHRAAMDSGYATIMGEAVNNLQVDLMNFVLHIKFKDKNNNVVYEHDYGLPLQVLPANTALAFQIDEPLTHLKNQEFVSYEYDFTYKVSNIEKYPLLEVTYEKPYVNDQNRYVLDMHAKNKGDKVCKAANIVVAFYGEAGNLRNVQIKEFDNILNGKKVDFTVTTSKGDKVSQFAIWSECEQILPGVDVGKEK